MEPHKPERLTVKVAVFLLIKRDGQYLFSQRKNPGYRDGFYTLPSGHLERGEGLREALVREAKEEINIDIDPADLQFVHVLYEQDVYTHFYFTTPTWQGEPINAEPDKCGEIIWATREDLRGTIVETVESALIHIENGVFFSETGAVNL